MTKTYNSQEKVTGEWVDPKSGKARPVSIKKKFRGHVWTQDELNDLFAGKKLTLDLKSSSGSTYTLTDVCIDHRSFTNPEGKEIKGVWVDGVFRKTVPNEFCQHVFTDEEKQALQNGETVHVDGMISSKGNEFSADLKWGKNTYQGKERTGIYFPENQIR